jgi:hypothetical protein
MENTKLSAIDRQCHEMAVNAADDCMMLVVMTGWSDIERDQARGYIATVADSIIELRTDERCHMLAERSRANLAWALGDAGQMEQMGAFAEDDADEIIALRAAEAAQEDFDADAKAADDELIGADIWNAAEAAQEVQS